MGTQWAAAVVSLLSMCASAVAAFAVSHGINRLWNRSAGFRQGDLRHAVIAGMWHTHIC